VTGSDRLALSAPIDTPDVPTIEIASPTRRDEARSAMAVAAALRDSGVPVRDIAVAVRDLDPYEEPLLFGRRSSTGSHRCSGRSSA